MSEITNDYSSDSSYSSDSDIEMKPKIPKSKLKNKIIVVDDIQPVNVQPPVETVKPKRKYTQKPKTPEQKQALIDRLAKAREAKANKKVVKNVTITEPVKEVKQVIEKIPKERKERKEVHHHYHTQSPAPTPTPITTEKIKEAKPKLERSRPVQQQPPPSRYSNVGFD